MNKQENVVQASSAPDERCSFSTQLEFIQPAGVTLPQTDYEKENAPSQPVKIKRPAGFLFWRRLGRKAMLPLFLLSCLFTAHSLSLAAGAAEYNAPLKALQDDETIFLPYMHAQREMFFTKPKVWTLSPNSHVFLEFRHSDLVLPGVSWLEVIINNHTMAHIPYSAANVDNTTLKVPIPVGDLKDFNSLIFRVEHHTPGVCPDPLDPAMWTQILPQTHLVFDYQPALPDVDLSAYPYPIVDPLGYAPSEVQYILSSSPATEELHALTAVNIELAQAARKKGVKSHVVFAGSNQAATGHRILIGTPADNPEIAKYQSGFKYYKLSGTQWMNPYTNAPMSGETGLLFYIPDPADKSQTVLVVTGNSPKGVLQAANYLTTLPREPKRAGQAVLIPDNWSTPDSKSMRVSKFIENQNRTFAQLDYPIMSVEKITAPPITYKLPVVGDFSRPDSKLSLDVVYSYGPEMNTVYSSLELRMNDRAIGNIPLTNPNGETMQHATVPIPNDLIQPNNKLVAQFHLMPIKYGLCGKFIEKGWGKIHDNSEFRVEGPVGSLLPDAGLLNKTGFPYTRNQNFENVHFVLPAHPDATVLQTFLDVTARLGKVTDSDTDLRFTLGHSLENLPHDRDTLAVGTDAIPGSIGDQMPLLWPDPHVKAFKIQDGKASHIGDDATAGYLEQAALPGANDHMVTLIYSKSPAGYHSLQNLLETDKYFETLPLGRLVQIFDADAKSHGITPPNFRKPENHPSFFAWLWDTITSIPPVHWISYAVGFLCLLILLPLIFRRFRRR